MAFVVLLGVLGAFGAIKSAAACLAWFTISIFIRLYDFEAGKRDFRDFDVQPRLFELGFGLGFRSHAVRRRDESRKKTPKRILRGVSEQFVYPHVPLLLHNENRRFRLLLRFLPPALAFLRLVFGQPAGLYAVKQPPSFPELQDIERQQRPNRYNGDYG